jgi:hypothetical protein
VSAPPVIVAAPVTLRHVKRAAAGTVVVGATFAAQAPVGVNGERGYQSGTYEPALSEDGTATVSLPNAVGEDGVLHRRRFACLTDSGYEVGDEWVEVWEGVPGRGRVLFVGTPVDWKKGRAEVSLSLADGAGLLPAQRTFAAGFWNHAPRDAFEHYTKAWRTVVAEDFVGGYDPARWLATPGTYGTITNQPSAVRLSIAGAPTESDAQITTYGSYWPTVNLATSRAWRAECRFSQALTGSAGVGFQLYGGTNFATIQTDSSGRVEAILSNVATGVFVNNAIPLTAIDVTLAMERHDRWVLFYAQGALVWAGEANWSTSITGDPYFSLLDYAGGASGYVDLDYIIVRDLQPYLMRGPDKGDYRLPGSPTPGGLRGTYFDDADLRTVGYTTADYYYRILAPTRQPYARRQDPTINFPTATPPTWQPAGPASGEYFSVRWTGAIYLDLANVDVTLRLDQLDDAARLWVGKTMVGQHLLARWQPPAGGAPFTLTSGSLRTHLGAGLSGWYPLRLEYASGLGAVGIVLQQSVDGGAYAAVPSTSLSPFGVYEAEVRYDSHVEQVRSLVETFGLQYRVEPRSLESGLFPGEMVPRIRVGRDTDKVLEPPESTDVAVSGSARDTVAALLADAAGLADQANAAQLTSEAVDFDALWAAAVEARHLAVMSGYESLSDVTDPNLLRTRLAAMLTLRSAPWEEVGARPRGAREIRDTFPPSFPVAGALAAFDWEPGDGVRLRDDAVDLDDDSPRQIIAPAWPFGPDGRGAPTVRFRQRPRSQQNALRELVRAVLLPQRNYQGQLVVVNGSFAANPPTATILDAFTRVSLPEDLSAIVRATLVVQSKGDTSTGTIAVNGVGVAVTLQTAGRYDVTQYVARDGSSQRMYCHVGGHTSSCEYMLEMLVTV